MHTFLRGLCIDELLPYIQNQDLNSYTCVFPCGEFYGYLVLRTFACFVWKKNCLEFEGLKTPRTDRMDVTALFSDKCSSHCNINPLHAALLFKAVNILSVMKPNSIHSLYHFTWDQQKGGFLSEK